MQSRQRGFRMLEGAKWTFTTRRIRPECAAALDCAVSTATTGHLLLAEVSTIGQHKRLQLAQGRYSTLYVGDRVVAVCGSRYAPDQFEVEAEIDPDGCDLAAGGGVVGRMIRANDSMRAPTRLIPLGLLCNGTGQRMTVADAALPEAIMPAVRPAVIAVTGSSMNAGKTTTVASLAKGLARAGFTVGTAKVTGTGAFGDVHAMLDAGVEHVLDFTDAGLPSTYKVPPARLVAIARNFVAHLAQRGCDVVLLELADGVFQKETAALIRLPAFHELCDGVLFAAADALGAVSVAREVQAAGLKLLGFSGIICRSPTAMAEAEQALRTACLRQETLFDPDAAERLLAVARGSARGSDGEHATQTRRRDARHAA